MKLPCKLLDAQGRVRLMLMGETAYVVRDPASDERILLPKRRIARMSIETENASESEWRVGVVRSSLWALLTGVVGGVLEMVSTTRNKQRRRTLPVLQVTMVDGTRYRYLAGNRGGFLRQSAMMYLEDYERNRADYGWETT